MPGAVFAPNPLGRDMTILPLATSSEMLADPDAPPVAAKPLHRYVAAHIRRGVSKIPLLRRVLGRHPFDREYGTDTSGNVPVRDLRPTEDLSERAMPYSGSQPSIVRKAIRLLQDHERYVFVDLGCGKGRPLLVASDFPFRRIVGIDISPSLATCAERNANLFGERYPDRTKIEIVCSDIQQFEIDAPHIVAFIYHSVPRPVLQRLVHTLEAALRSTAQHIVFIYYNPVCGDVLDSSGSFVRMFAQAIPYDIDELGYGPDTRDSVVMWQSVPERFPALEHANSIIQVIKSGWYAQLGPG